MSDKAKAGLEPGRLPWTQAGPYSVLDAEGNDVCVFLGPNKAVNRALVLRAVNVQAEPLAAIVEYVAAVQAWQAVPPDVGLSYEETVAVYKRLLDAETALFAIAASALEAVQAGAEGIEAS